VRDCRDEGNLKFPWRVMFIESHGTSHACFVCIFLDVFATKCSMASGDRNDWCGPSLRASHISSFDHESPIFVGHPNSENSWKMSVAGCCSMQVAGHIRLQYAGWSLWFVGGKRTSRPVYIFHAWQDGWLHGLLCSPAMFVLPVHHTLVVA
jgi:hypothetical protein